MDWTTFFYMGGYGRYVWPAYAFVAILLVLNIALPLRARGATIKRARAVATRRPPATATTAPAAKRKTVKKKRS